MVSSTQIREVDSECRERFSKRSAKVQQRFSRAIFLFLDFLIFLFFFFRFFFCFCFFFLGGGGYANVG